MTYLANYQLVHPELLTEEILHQVLKDRCIEMPRFMSTDKTELVEIFKRVALPLPQRKYDDRTHLGRKLISFHRSRDREQLDAKPPDITSSSSDAKFSTANNSDRLKPPLSGIETESKKIRLSKTRTTPYDTPRDNNKRTKVEALSERPECNKRRKITWP